MKKLTVLCIAILVIQISQIEAQQAIWATNFAEAELYASTADNEGNVYTGGLFYGTITMDGLELTNGTPNAAGWIAKHDKNGIPKFLELVYATEYLVVLDMESLVDGGIVICGIFVGKAWLGDFNFGNESDELYRGFVAKYNADGECTAAYVSDETQSVYFYALSQDEDGNIFIAGAADGFFEFGVSEVAHSGDSDAIYGKMEADLNPLWMKSIGGADFDFANEITVDVDGNIIISGSHEGMFEEDSYFFDSYGYSDIFVVKTDANGFIEWNQNMGSAESDGYLIADLETDDEGNIYYATIMGETLNYIGGSINSYGEADMVMMKLAANTGNVNWILHGGGSDTDPMNKMIKGHNNNFYVCGYFYGAAEFQGLQLFAEVGADGYLAEISEGGSVNVVSQTDGDNIEAYQSIAIDQNNNLLLSGYFFGNLSFEGIDPITSVSDEIDIFIVKMETPYTLPEVAIQNWNNLANAIITPNPASSTIVFEIENNTDNLNITFFNSNGQQIAVVNANCSKPFNVSSFPAGIYTALATNSQGELIAAQKFIKQ